MKKRLIIGIILAVLVVILGIYFYGGTSRNCAKEGGKYSKVFTEEYPESCCENLKEYESGMDTSISIMNICYNTGLLSGWPVGVCLNCGNNICEDIESVCSCPEDCIGLEKSNYNTIQEFCNEAYNDYCEGNEDLELELCNLC